MAHKAAQNKVELTAQPRTITGQKVRQLRASGILPAVMYGKGQESIALELPVKDFEKAYQSAGESTLVYLHVGDKQYPTIINAIARDPMSGNILHADFYKVRLDERIKAMVPVVFVGESPAVKGLGGIFVRNINELEVEALPTDMPHEISIDISKMTELNSQLSLKNVKVANARLTGNPEEIVASVTEPMSEEELKASLEAPTTDVTAVEEIKKEKPAEEVAEGETSAPAPTPIAE